MAEFAGLASVQALAWALVHFLWQGTLIAIAAALLLRAFERASTRYAIGIAALVAMLVTPVVTFLSLLGAPSIAPGLEASGSFGAVSNAGALVAQAESTSVVAGSSSGWWPALGVVVWIAGMLVLSIRLAGGWIVARRMATRAVRPAADHIQAVARSLSERLQIGRAVDVLESSAVAVPVLVGWLRPAVVFPVAALAGLSPVQIEALLAHELAHVRRHDYLINLMQSFAEIVLFYHPAVWWLSRRVRTERELCCDDLAVGLCDRLVYATALTDLAAMRAPRVALAATGGDLLTRVRRILQREEAPMSNSRWIPALIISALILAVVPVTLASVNPAREQAAPAVVIPALDPEVPAAQKEVAAAMSPAEPAELVAPVEESVEQSATEIAQAQRAREIEALRARLEQLAAEQNARQFEAVRERENVGQAELAKQLKEMAARQFAEDAKQNADRLQRMFEVGLASQGQLEEARKAVKLAEAGPDERKRVVIEVEALERQLEDVRKRVEIGVLPADAIARLESQLTAARMSGSARELRERLDERYQQARRTETEALSSEYEAQRQALQRRIVERAREVAPEPRERELEAIPSRPIAAGDTLFISIEGESGLPTIYLIDSDGTIRVPLLGAFKVMGQTPGQVREAIGKKLMDAKLGSPAKVRVELRQNREVRRVIR